MSEIKISPSYKEKSKLFKWEGWKKEIIWIIFFVFLILIVFAYRADTNQCKEIQKTECFLDCAFEKSVEETIKERPDWQMICNYTSRTCEVAGLLNENELEFEYELEMNSIQNDTNNTRTNTPKD